MTVTASTAKSGPYAGSGTTGPFTVGFRFLENAHLQVIRTSAAGIDTTLTLTTNYTVTGAGAASGAVTLVTALAVGEKLTIVRNVPFTQEADYVQNDAFPAESHERALDKLTMEVQQVGEVAGRALVLPASTTGVSPLLPAPEANKVLGWNNAASALQNFDVQSLASVVAYGTADSDIFTGNGSQTQFVLSANPGVLDNLDVSVNGLTYLPGLDYTWVGGTTVTFSVAPAVGDQVLIRYMQALAIGTSDSSLVQYTPAGAGAVVRTAQAKLREAVSVLDFGAVGDGVADDTAAIQAAITFSRLQGGESRKLYWSRGTYKITAALILGTNQCIEFDPGVTISFAPADPLNTPLFTAANQSEVYLSGNGAVLNGTRGSVAGQGTGTAFFLYGSDNVTLRNFIINDFATDGITITGDNTGSNACRNVLIENCYVNNCRRNGMSIISAKGCVVIGGEYNNTNGALSGPWAGIDIEPNSDCFLEDVTLVGVNTSGNAGSGIQITPGAFGGLPDKRFHVNIIGGRSLNDGDTLGVAGLYFVNASAAITNKIFGEIVVSGFTVDQPLSRGVSFREWDADKCPRAIVENVTVYNPDSTSSAVQQANRSAFVIDADSSQFNASLGNIVLRNCHAEDLRASPRMPWGMLLAAASGKVVKNILIENPKSINFVSTAKADIFTSSSSGPGASVDTDIVYLKSDFVNLSGSQSIAAFGGKPINITASGSLYTLPFAAACAGMSYIIQNAQGVDSSTIGLQSGDLFSGIIDVANSNLVLDAGGFIKLRSLGGTAWHVEAIGGKWRRFGTAVARLIQWSASVPSSGTWTQGDKVFNQVPSVGQPKGWVCTVSGTPGNWVSEGNL